MDNKKHSENDLKYQKYKYELFKNIDEAKKKYLDDHDNYKESK